MKTPVFHSITIAVMILAVLTTKVEKTHAKNETNYQEVKQREANEEHWIVQRLNHFDAIDKRSWLQRYKKSDAFYRTGGPAILYVGGESGIGTLYLNSSQLLMKLTKKFGAMLFQLEHRFYGKSKPTNDTSVGNLRFLSSQQALEDLGYFIKNMTTTSDVPLHRWILIGGSYPGSLAVWARLKFPHLVYGVVAASPPFEAKLFFEEYMESVNATLYEYGGLACHSAVARANEQIAKLMETEDGKEKLRDIFNLCNGSSLHGNSMDLFHSIMNNQIENVVQYSKGNIIIEQPNYITLNTMCDVMTNESIGPEIYRLQKMIDMRNNYTDCVTTSFSEYSSHDRNATWGVQSSSRSWLYQACTEFGWFQTVSQQPFQPVPKSFPTALCLGLFGPELQVIDVINGPTRTNIDYGGKAIADIVTHTVIFNGGVDPWHKVSYSKSNVQLDLKNLHLNDTDKKRLFAAPGESQGGKGTLNFQSPFGFSSIFVAESSHAEVLSAERQRDSIELRNSRTAILKLVDLWLRK